MILTGDLHANASGELNFLKFNYLLSRYGDKCKNTYIIILGDGGLLWYNDPYSDFGGELLSELQKTFDILNTKFIVIPGNHENYKRIYSLPKVKINDDIHPIKGEFRKITDFLYYTERFGEYLIENNSILVLGGAKSIDAQYRELGKTYFLEETYTIEEKDYILNNLIKDYKYVFVHTCPDFVLKKIYNYPCSRDNNSEFFSKLMNYIHVQKWYFGHLHPDPLDVNLGNFKDLNFFDTEYKCLYKSLQDVV